MAAGAPTAKTLAGMIAINQGARARALDAPRECSFQSGGYMQLEPGPCTG